MARKQPVKPLAEAPPEPESSSTSSYAAEEDDDDSSTDADEPTTATQHPAVSSSDEEDEEQTPATPPSKKPTSSAAAAVTTSAAHQSSSSEEEDPEEDSDDEPPLQLAKLKSTPKPTSPPPKPRSKPTIAALPADTKRSSETTPLEKEKTSKKSKNDPATPAFATATKSTSLSPGPNEDGSKKLFQRVFSGEDEIEILKGLIDFKERKGSDPLKNDDEFYGFIKKRVSVDVSKGQVVDKVRRLKRKFNRNVKMVKKKNMNVHDKTVFELSKKIWEVKDVDDDGDVKVKGANGSVVKENDNKSAVSKKSGAKSDEKEDNGVVTIAKMGNVDEESDDDLMEEDIRVGQGEVKERMRSEALKRMGENGREEIREMWREVEIAQLEVDLMRHQARVHETKRIMEALGVAKRQGS